MKPRTLIMLLCAVAAAAAVVLLAGQGTPSTALDPVAQAAEATMRSGGARAAMSGTVSDPAAGLSMTLTGGGSMNFATNEADLSLAITGLPAAAAAKLHGRPLTMRERFTGGALYIGSPLFAGKLPGGASWLKLDLKRISAAMGLNPGSLTSGEENPAEYLAYLRSRGSTLTASGSAVVRGVPKTRYSGQLNLLKAVESDAASNLAQARAAIEKIIAETGESSYPMEVWVDGNHMVRRVSVTLDLKASGQQLSERINSEYFDFGPTLKVAPPPSSEVSDITSSALQGISGAGQ